MRAVLLTLVAGAAPALLAHDVAHHVAPTAQRAPAVALISGIELKNMDRTVRPQDDIYAYTNGGWLKTVELPADKSSRGSFDDLRETALVNLHIIIEQQLKDASRVAHSEAQQIADLYASFLDQARRDKLGIRPLTGDLARIDALQDKSALAEMVASMNRMRVTAPVGMGVVQDAKDATQYVVSVSQSGLGLPDRDYYLNETDAKMAQTRGLIAQYSAYSPIAGYHVNGALSLGENIGDNSGLAIAYKAYKLSLGGKDGPVIDGLTGDQRLFMGWAQIWRSKTRPDAMIVQMKTGPHSPAPVRGFATLRNQPGFYSAFGVKEGDKMYLPPEQRVTIW